MPCLYRRFADEIHVYYTRIPKKDGGKAGLLIPVAGILLLFFGVWMCVIAFTLNLILIPEQPSEIGRHTVPFVFVLALYFWVFSGYWKKLIFSRRTGMVSRGFLLKKSLGRFEDFSCIMLEEDVLGMGQCLSLVWKDKRKEPLRLSPVVRDGRRLAAYYHEIVPLLTEYMELPPPPVEYAFETSASPTAVGPGDIHGENKYRHFVYNGKTGLYSEKAVAPSIVLTVLLLFSLTAAGCVSIYFEIWILQVFLIVFVLALLWGLRKECIAARLDPRDRAIIAYTHFGFRKKRLPLEALENISQCEFGFFHSAALLFNQGDLKMVGIADSFSAGATRDGLREFGQIMGINVEMLHITAFYKTS